MLGDRIRLLRESQGMKQEQLGKCLGVSKQTVSNWENGNIMPAVDRLEQMIKLFNTTPNFIFGFEDHSTLDLDGLSEAEIAHVYMIVNDLKALHKAADGQK